MLGSLRAYYWAIFSFISMKLTNKIALITGAGKGIGRAIAEGFASQGAIVLVNDLPNSPDAPDTVAAINAKGGQAVFFGGDVSKTAEIDALFGRIQNTFGRLDVLVNNAGITGWGTVWDTSEEMFDAVMNTNLKGTFFCSVAAARLMRHPNSGGSIINISTKAASLGIKNLSAYAASKGGIHALTKQFAVELAPHNIRVNTFGPGAINVERNLHDDPEYATHWGAVIPMGRTGQPEEMVGPAIFLASNDSSFVTGQLFYADGGWSVQGRLPENSLDAQLKSNEGK